MKTIKTLSSAIGLITIFGVIVAAILLLIYNPGMYLSQTYLLIHYLGICVLVIILSFKISDYAGIFMNPQKSLLFTLIQLALLLFLF